MVQVTTATARYTVSNRSGNSRKLLARKAIEQAAGGEPAGEALEDSFPNKSVSGDPATSEQADGDVRPAPSAPGSEQGDATAAPAAKHFEPAADAAPSVAAVGSKERGRTWLLNPARSVAPTPPLLPVWSPDDEAAFQAMTARRKAARFQRRGKDVSCQLLRVGDIAPNPNTVVAVIVNLVAERGRVQRGTLIDAMASATFPHPKAKPDDRAWCTGYIAGAVRDGFLSAASDGATADDREGSQGTQL